MKEMDGINHQDLILQLFDIGAVKFGSFKLKSGIISPLYVDLRVVPSRPTLLQQVIHLMFDSVKKNSPDTKFDQVCGVPYTALPMATVLSVKESLPLIIVRKEVKDYGTKQQVRKRIFFRKF